MHRRRPGDHTDPLDPDRIDRPERPERPEPLEPPEPPPPPPEGAIPSITSWTRLEVRSRQADMRQSLSARVFDPLWLMARQWQLGEFQGADAGMPVLARVRAQTSLLSRIHLGELPPNTMTQAAAYDPARMPLEVMVERQRLRAANSSDVRMLRLSAEAGLHFLLMLEQEPLSKNYRAAFIARFALQAPSATALNAADEDTVRFVTTMVGRALDARRLAEALRSGGASQLVSDTALQIAVGDRAEVGQTAARWLEWYDNLFSEPVASDDAWIPPRMEYALTVAGRLSDDRLAERPLTASEFFDGHLDWSSFDLNFEVNLGTERDRKFSSIVETTVPAPVVFRGAPAPRYWELEDARIEYGLMPVGPTDLAQLLLIEYASGYGNDWFVVPLTLAIGSLTSVTSFVVTDSFGVKTLLRPIGERALPAPHWHMYQLAHVRRAGADPLMKPASNLFFLPPSLGRSLQSAAVEDVLFMRDEMANVAWAIERSIESPVEQRVPRTDTEPRQDSAADTGAPPPSEGAIPRYLLSTTVPSNWIPLLPVQLAEPPDKIVSRLRRGAVLQPDGSERINPALGRILNKDPRLLMFDEEVPREGIHVARHYQLARWIDGSSWVWMALRKEVGRGEGSSGLRFDSVSS